MEKGKGKEMTFDEHCEEFKKEIKNLSHLEEEASRSKKKRSVLPAGQRQSLRGVMGKLGRDKGIRITLILASPLNPCIMQV